MGTTTDELPGAGWLYPCLSWNEGEGLVFSMQQFLQSAMTQYRMQGPEVICPEVICMEKISR